MSVVLSFLSEEVKVKRDLLHNPEEPHVMGRNQARHKQSECTTFTNIQHD